ncbi:MAG: hypothetical protein R2786_07225 [Flavobacteriaceae bacterium]
MNHSKPPQKSVKTSYPSYPTWMQDNISSLGDKKLSEICIPGSHDSGMYKRTVGGKGGIDCNTLTQTYPIAGQLQYGARYFDIRPGIASGGFFYTGHYSETLGVWVGANGQSIADIITDINTFTESSNELIILNLSHAINTNDGYRDLNQDEWYNLFSTLTAINHLFISQGGDLTSYSLNQFIGGNKPAVVIIVQPKGSISLGDYANNGFYLYDESFNVINKYSDTDNFDDMKHDQIKKMEKYAGSYFLLSWTLTQGIVEAAKCYDTPGLSIIDLANVAAANLSDLLKHVTANVKPNILYLDNIGNCDLVGTVMEINNI